MSAYRRAFADATIHDVILSMTLPRRDTVLIEAALKVAAIEERADTAQQLTDLMSFEGRVWFQYACRVARQARRHPHDKGGGRGAP